MHIAILSHEYPPYIYGGIGTFASNLASGLSKKGIDVTVLTGQPLVSKGFGEIKDIQMANDKIILKRFPYLNTPPSHIFFQLQNIKKISNTIKELKPDIIHGQCGSTFPLIMDIKEFAPVVTTFHSSPLVEKKVSSYSLLRGGTFSDLNTYVLGYHLMSYVFKREITYSKMNVAVSNNLMTELLEEMGSKYQAKICTIPNGIDIESLDKEIKSLGELKNESDKIENNTIVYAGRLFWRKGSLNVIKLARLLKKLKSKYKIIVFGTGPLYGKMVEEIKANNLSNIVLRGFTSRKQLLTSLKNSRLTVIPSLYEACPMILLESMCLGKVPVMYNLPFAREFTDNGKYAVLTRDTNDMAIKINTIEDEFCMGNLSREVSQFAREKYNIDKVVKEYCALYKQFA
jgi:glycogen synthase